MSTVALYIYDLSRGLARQLSLQLTGRQIDGIWHTSVVVFGKEIFYGQGISIVQPGESRHGSPLRVVEMGETGIDEDTFNDYIAEKRRQYTANKYHLLNFNCNTFTEDCIGFLTGGSIPSFITSLPSDFLSSPFGAALRPIIDGVSSSGPMNGVVPTRPTPNMVLPSSGLAPNVFQSIAEQSSAGGQFFGGAPSMPPAMPAPAPVPALTPAPAAIPPPSMLPSPVHITTTPASFHTLLGSHRAVVAFFTSTTCAPCRLIEPAFEDIAKSKNKVKEVGFAKIDLGVGSGGALAGEYQVSATPTFLFFLNGKKTYELKGVNAPELRTQVDLLIYEAFPPHAHILLSLPAVEAISLEPILFKQVSNLDTMFTKFAGFIDGVTPWTGAVTQAQVKQTLSKTVLPFLKASTATPAQQPKPTSFDHWPALTLTLVANLQLNELFPMVDIWRIALLNASFTSWAATKKVQDGPLQRFVDKALEASEVPRNYLLTVLRMLANAFSNRVLAREMILSAREGVTKVLVDALLHDDAAVRTAAASLGFNVAAYLQRLRVDRVKARNDSRSAEESEEWECEIVVAVLDAVEREKSSEETVHRLVACLGLLLRLSPHTAQVTPLLEALGAQTKLKGKLEKGGCGENGVVKKEVRKLISEVADKLCPAA